jgi:hypothetical protein
MSRCCIAYWLKFLRIRAESRSPWRPWYDGGRHGSSCFIDLHEFCAYVKYTFPPNKIFYCSRAIIYPPVAWCKTQQYNHVTHHDYSPRKVSSTTRSTPSPCSPQTEGEETDASSVLDALLRDAPPPPPPPPPLRRILAGSMRCYRYRDAQRSSDADANHPPPYRGHIATYGLRRVPMRLARCEFPPSHPPSPDPRPWRRGIGIKIPSHEGTALPHRAMRRRILSAFYGVRRSEPRLAHVSRESPSRTDNFRGVSSPPRRRKRRRHGVHVARRVDSASWMRVVRESSHPMGRRGRGSVHDRGERTSTGWQIALLEEGCVAFYIFVALAGDDEARGSTISSL